MKDAKSYDPNVDKAGLAEVPMGQRVEQVKNGGPGSGNFGHAGRPGEVGGSGEGGGGSTKGESSKIRVSVPDNEGGATYHDLHGYKREKSPASSTPARKTAEVKEELSRRGSGEGRSGFSRLPTQAEIDASDEYDRRSSGKMESGYPKDNPSGEYAVRYSTFDKNDRPVTKDKVFKDPHSRFKFMTKLQERDDFAGIHATSDPHQQKNADLMQPGTAFVPQGNKTEAVTNPPYRTPELGDAPEEMQKEADRIYKALRKEQFHEETPADRESAARVMWTTLEKNWKKGKDGKWVKKEKSE